MRSRSRQRALLLAFALGLGPATGIFEAQAQVPTFGPPYSNTFPSVSGQFSIVFMLSMAADFTAFTSNYDPNQTTSDPADPFLQLFQGDQTSGTPLAEDFDGAADYSTDTGMLFTAGGLPQSGGPVFDSLIQISDTTQPTGLDAGTYTLLISPTTTVNTQQPPTSGFGDFLRVNVVTQAKPSP